MEPDASGDPLHQAEARLRDFLALFPGLVILAAVWRLAGWLAQALEGRAELAEARGVLERLRDFAEGRTTLAYLGAEEDRAPLGRFADALSAALPGPPPGREQEAVALLQEWLSVARDPDAQGRRLGAVSRRDDAWQRGL
jgi:hypothetical protein